MRTTDTVGRGTANGELVAGARVGNFVVKAVADNGLMLRGSRRFAMWQFMIGLVVTALGLCAWASVLRGDAASTGAHGKVLVFPIAGIVWMLSGFLLLGEVWQFDATGRKFSRVGFFRFDTLPADQMHSVRLTALPTNLRQRETLVLEMIAGTKRFSIGSRRTSKPDAMNLITLAERIASILHLPLETSGELVSAPPAMRERFALLAAHPQNLQRAA